MVVDLIRSRAALEAEIWTLRQQINVLRRTAPKKLSFSAIDRLIFVGLYRLFANARDALAIVKPDTIVRWHRAGFRSYWRWKSRPRGGRPTVPLEIRRLIRAMSIANPLWGAPRIHGELLKLGIDIGQTSVAKYMAKPRRPPSQGWKTFLNNHADGIAAMDLFVVPTISFRLLYGLLIVGHGRRQILWFGVTSHPTAEWIANQLTEACGWEQAPRYLIRDRDRAYGEVFIRRLRSMGIRDRPTSPRSPWQNGFAERLIGSIRRECLDHVVVFGERHLRHVLLSYMNYYNETRTHLSLDKDSPLSRTVERAGRILCRQSSADCITNTSGFDLRQAQRLVHRGVRYVGLEAGQGPARRTGGMMAHILVMECRLVAHGVISLRRGSWSLSANSGPFWRAFRLVCRFTARQDVLPPL